MSYEADTASRYRQRATELRSIAQASRDREMARAVRLVAIEYEAMAVAFDQIASAATALAGPSRA